MLLTRKFHSILVFWCMCSSFSEYRTLFGTKKNWLLPKIILSYSNWKSAKRQRFYWNQIEPNTLIWPWNWFGIGHFSSFHTLSVSVYVLISYSFIASVINERSFHLMELKWLALDEKEMAMKEKKREKTLKWIYNDRLTAPIFQNDNLNVFKCPRLIILTVLWTIEFLISNKKCILMQIQILNNLSYKRPTHTRIR